ncbi:hypothetical protein BDR26DRAFT_934942 [Obelidium mucronatum]|nr:hypothetical protein BDR26DRAFT_934942 [Obelidium mucronatum]
MPEIKFENNSLVITPSTEEMVLAASLQEVKIPYSQIKSVRTRPGEAYAVFRGIKVGTHVPGVITDATYYHVNGKKADLHLYSKPDQSIALDLEGHVYGIVVIQVPNQTPQDLAQRIFKEADLKGEIQDNGSEH